MTYSNTYSSPSSPTNFNPFSGMGMRKGGRPSLFPGSGDGSTLNLDFTSGVLDSRLTFSRASTATFVNSSGYVEWAGANLIVYSNAFTSGTWYLGGTPANLTPNYAVGPDGITGSAWRFQGALSNSVFAQPISNNGFAHVVSIYAKSNTGANQTFTIYNGVSGTTCTATSVWQRFEVPVAGTWGYAYFGTLGASQDILIWGAQSNLGSTAQTYYPTTTAAYHAPRFDYSPTNIGESRGLLVEGSSINKIYGSESLASSGMPINWSYAGNVTRNSTLVTSPRGSDDAVVVNETVTSGLHRVSQSSFSGYTVGAVCTFSCWAKVAKSATPRKLFVNLAGLLNSQGLFDLTATGTSGTAQATGGTAVNKATSWIKYPGDWYRVTVTGNFVAESSQFLQMNRASSTTCADDSFIGETDNGIIIWGCQLEAGSGASSYIVTGASQVTRNTDYCTIPTASFIPSNPYPQTLFVDCIPNTPSGAFLDLVRVLDRTAGGTFAYGTQIYYYNAPTMIPMRKIYASTNSERNLANGLAYGTRHKFALSIDAASYSGSYDGVTALGVATAPTALATVVTHMGIGCSGDSSAQSVMFGTIRQIKFYPTALSQSAINTLTTL